jgi:hypothetical protein
MAITLARNTQYFNTVLQVVRIGGKSECVLQIVARDTCVKTHPFPYFFSIWSSIVPVCFATIAAFACYAKTIFIFDSNRIKFPGEFSLFTT